LILNPASAIEKGTAVREDAGPFDSGFAIWDAGFAIRDPGSTIRDPGSAISD
jgi:hypothetical protein